MSTPAEDGFAAQPDWAPLARVWLAWPSAERWGGRLSDAREEVAALARTIALHAPVTVIAPASCAPDVSLRCGAGVAVLPHAVDEPWIADFGPTFVQDGDGDVAGVDWRYRGWGGALRTATDRLIAPAMLENLRMARFESDLPIEGGLVQVDGAGRALASRPGLAEGGRLAKFDPALVEAALRAQLGVEAVLWTDARIDGDEAGGRIDAVAAFVGPGRLAVMQPRRDADPLRAAADAIHETANAAGLSVIALPAPKRTEAEGGGRAPRSYAGFVVAGGVVVCPSFEDPADDAAADALQKLFPDRVVAQTPATALAAGGATLRAAACLQPAGPPAP